MHVIFHFIDQPSFCLLAYDQFVEIFVTLGGIMTLSTSFFANGNAKNACTIWELSKNNTR